MLFDGNEPGLFQKLQMPTGRRLCDAKRLRNQRHANAKLHRIGGPLIAEMDFRFRQQAQDGQPGLTGQGLDLG